MRNDLARELHDRVAQTLTTMLVEMENFKGGDFERERVLNEVTAYQEATRAALSNIREILYELRGDESIGEEFASRVRRLLVAFEEKSGITATLSVEAAWPSQLATQSAVNLYRLLEEALTNVRRHSGANSVAVGLNLGDGDRAVVTVLDDGYGISPTLGERVGLGLAGMRERALLLGGEIRIERIHPHGTLVTASIPKENLV